MSAIYNLETVAKRMYGAYCYQAGSNTSDSKPMPTYAQLGLKQQECWIAAAKQAYQDFTGVH